MNQQLRELILAIPGEVARRQAARSIADCLAMGMSYEMRHRSCLAGFLKVPPGTCNEDAVYLWVQREMRQYDDEGLSTEEVILVLRERLREVVSQIAGWEQPV